MFYQNVKMRITLRLTRKVECLLIDKNRASLKYDNRDPRNAAELFFCSYLRIQHYIITHAEFPQINNIAQRKKNRVPT